jgi:hypothetical protein
MDNPANDYRDIVVRWLLHKHYKWRDTAKRELGAAADAASFYAAAYGNAAEGIRSGQPERWAEHDRSIHQLKPKGTERSHDQNSD